MQMQINQVIFILIIHKLDGGREIGEWPIMFKNLIKLETC